MKSLKHFLFHHGLTLLLFIATLCFIIYRAIHLGFTHDEALTYTVVRGEVMWRYTANNHWLNTLLMKWSWPVFGVSEWSLRLPNILAFLLYAWAGKRIFYKEGKSMILYIFFFAALLANQFVLDFFGLARGYGLAEGFFALALSYLFPWVQHKRVQDQIKLLLCLILSFYANFSFLIPIAVIGGLSFLFTWDWQVLRKRSFKNPLIPYVIAAVLFLPGLKALFGLSESGQLYIGQTSNFIDTTFFSYLMMVVSGYNKTLGVNWFYVLHFCLLLFGLILGWKDRKLLLSSLIIIGTGVMIILFHIFLKMNYPVERTIIYFYPLFLVFYYHLLTTQAGLNILIWPSRILIIGMILLQFVSFSEQVNLDYALTWRDNGDTKSILEDLEEYRTPNDTISLGIPWYLEPTVNFYRKNNRLHWLEPATRDGIFGKPYDFYVLEPEQGAIADSLSLETLKRYHVSGKVLYKSHFP